MHYGETEDDTSTTYKMPSGKKLSYQTTKGMFMETTVICRDTRTVHRVKVARTQCSLCCCYEKAKHFQAFLFELQGA